MDTPLNMSAAESAQSTELYWHLAKIFNFFQAYK